MPEKGQPAEGPAMTFENFVVGSANRLAAAAARRACESPGTTYNPLFLYSAPGLGKTHILHAIAALTAELHPECASRYRESETYLGEIAKAAGKGKLDALLKEYDEVGLLLLDDIQSIAGRVEVQEGLLKALDALTGKSAQVVLASDRPPSEIDGLDVRLLSRFSGGLIVDIGEPDYETRVGIVRREAEARGATLVDGVAEAVARFPLRNVRDLQRALSGVIAAEERYGRLVTVEDVPGLMSDLFKAPGAGAKQAAQKAGAAKPAPKPAGGAKPPSATQATPPAAKSAAAKPAPPAPTTKSQAPPEAPKSGARKGAEPWRKRIYGVADVARAEHVSALKLVRLLDHPDPPPDWEDLVGRFEAQLERIREIRRELKDLGDPWPQAAATLLTNPDRLEESESLLASARELRRPFAELPEGPGIRGLGGRYPALAVKAAEQLIRGAPSTYNPLYVHSLDSARCIALLEAVGRTYREGNPEARVGFTSLTDFALEFMNAIQAGVAGAWRERWWSLDLLLLHGVQDLAFVERAQDEVFHLFEALIRAGGRILVAGDRPPSRIEGVDDRVESKFEGGLVVDLGAEPTARAASKATTPKDQPADAAAPAEAHDTARAPDRERPPDQQRAAAKDRPRGAERGEPGIPWPPPHFDPSHPPPAPSTKGAGATGRPTPSGAPRPPQTSQASAGPPASTAPAAAPETPGGEKKRPADKGPAEKGPILTPPPRGPVADDLAALKELVGVVHVHSDEPKATSGAPKDAAPAGAAASAGGRRWAPSPEKAVLDWPEIEERIAEGAVRHSEVSDGHRG
jgi:chromosomal replication initiation ATPase DnaA